MVRYVLDSSAILRYLDDEAGAARVAEIIKSHLGGGGWHHVQVAWQAGDGFGALALERVWASDRCRRCGWGGSVVIDQAQKKNSVRGRLRNRTGVRLARSRFCDGGL